MGKHKPAGSTKNPTIADTLSDAEHDHVLDCPNAEPTLRASAFLIDIFFFFLAASGSHHLVNLSVAAATMLSADPIWVAQTFVLQLALRRVALIALAYGYFVWTLPQFGGTPGKILLGLRIVDDESGGLIQSGTAVMREILWKTLTVISIFGIFTPLFRTDRKMLHDLFSGTCVKKIFPVSEGKGEDIGS